MNNIKCMVIFNVPTDFKSKTINITSRRKKKVLLKQ
jgi:hypothetical protein